MFIVPATPSYRRKDGPTFQFVPEGYPLCMTCIWVNVYVFLCIGCYLCTVDPSAAAVERPSLGCAANHNIIRSGRSGESPQDHASILGAAACPQHGIPVDMRIRVCPVSGAQVCTGIPLCVRPGVCGSRIYPGFGHAGPG